MLFAKKREKKKITLSFNNHNIETKKQIKHFRVIFQKNGFYNAHVKTEKNKQ